MRRRASPWAIVLWVWIIVVLCSCALSGIVATLKALACIAVGMILIGLFYFLTFYEPRGKELRLDPPPPRPMSPQELAVAEAFFPMRIADPSAYGMSVRINENIRFVDPYRGFRGPRARSDNRNYTPRPTPLAKVRNRYPNSVKH